MHKWLVDVPKILHRDISLNNLMFRYDNGKKIGVLSDFDLANDESVVPKQGDATVVNMFRTGTQPFMALDLIDPKQAATRHLPRHDLESFFYVLIWQTSRYDGGKLVKASRYEGVELVRASRCEGEDLRKVKKRPLDEWEQLPYNTLYKEKVTALVKADYPDPTPNWTKFAPTIMDLADVFCDAFNAGESRQKKIRRRAQAALEASHEPAELAELVEQTVDEFDNATQGGKITYEIFLSHLKKLVKRLTPKIPKV